MDWAGRYGIATGYGTKMLRSPSLLFALTQKTFFCKKKLKITPQQL
jgi:hypothetical protein